MRTQSKEVITYKERAEISNLEYKFTIKSKDATKHTLDFNKCVYIPRVGNKSRILTPKDNMRNVLEISCETMSHLQLMLYVKSKFRYIDHLRMGTCQQFMRHGELLEILTNIFPNKGV